MGARQVRQGTARRLAERLEIGVDLARLRLAVAPLPTKSPFSSTANWPAMWKRRLRPSIMRPGEKLLNGGLTPPPIAVLLSQEHSYWTPISPNAQ